MLVEILDVTGFYRGGNLVVPPSAASLVPLASTALVPVLGLRIAIAGTRYGAGKGQSVAETFLPILLAAVSALLVLGSWETLVNGVYTTLNHVLRLAAGPGGDSVYKILVAMSDLNSRTLVEMLPRDDAASVVTQSITNAQFAVFVVGHIVGVFVLASLIAPALLLAVPVYLGPLLAVALAWRVALGRSIIQSFGQLALVAGLAPIIAALTARMLRPLAEAALGMPAPTAWGDAAVAADVAIRTGQYGVCTIAMGMIACQSMRIANGLIEGRHPLLASPLAVLFNLFLFFTHTKVRLAAGLLGRARGRL